MGNNEYWNEKFVNRSDNPLRPEKSLVDNIRYFKKGTVLDIACGDGRNALFLLEKCFSVTGIDFSSKALERLNLFGKRKGYLINTMQIDLDSPNPLKNIGFFDNIVINHYRLNKQQLADIERHLTSDGILFVSGFGHKHKVDSKIKEEDLIQPTDFENIEKSFELVNYTEFQDERGFFVTYIFCNRKI
ncbi:MAG: methyltransferase protein [Clostridiales bacterium]|jgi:2-polyprenyl-3-methyl-5-hydroxy-6-metoxy-1,4-benzoquinol methylase|nr:methyltransferase protein [Clostridiales bacterium]